MIYNGQKADTMTAEKKHPSILLLLFHTTLNTGNYSYKNSLKKMQVNECDQHDKANCFTSLN